MSNGDNRGTARISVKKLSLEVQHGGLPLKNVELYGKGSLAPDTPALLKDGEKRIFTVTAK